MADKWYKLYMVLFGATLHLTNVCSQHLWCTLTRARFLASACARRPETSTWVKNGVHHSACHAAGSTTVLVEGFKEEVSHMLWTGCCKTLKNWVGGCTYFTMMPNVF